jgi:imidazolonepropionase-like amidohydrolase
LRDAINRGIIPGPRIFAATECIASSGGYEVRQEAGAGVLGQTSVPRISDTADGIEGVRAAVRRRIGAGADVIKFYAEYRKRQLRFPPPVAPGGPDIRFPPKNEERIRNVILFTQDEMNAMVSEANVSAAPVAAHTSTARAVIMAAKARVTTIEHGYLVDKEGIQLMKENGVIFVPTLAAMELFVNGEELKAILQRTKAAYDAGVKLACGGDTGAFSHGENVRELELMAQAGVPVKEVLRAATLGGWEACGGALCARKFGCLEIGAAADIVAFRGDPFEDLHSVRMVDFVMKDGRVWKQNGQGIGMI